MFPDHRSYVTYSDLHTWLVLSVLSIPMRKYDRGSQAVNEALA